MNNSEFRGFLQNGKSETFHAGTSDGKPSMLGSRARTSMPMTPRSIIRRPPINEFASQVAEHERNIDGQPPTKRFKSSAAPKGTSLPNGYQDRTQLRRSDENGDQSHDDKARRLKALEEMFKLQQIDQATFEKLKEQIGVGGDVGSTHLVKGLDWKLLERVRRGEDINEASSSQEKANLQDGINVDDELDNVLDREVEAVITPGMKDSKAVETNSTDNRAMTRDEILRKLKESRNLQNIVKQLPEAALSEKFRKVQNPDRPNKKKFVETINGRRREVLLITDKSGNTKRKVRWLDDEKVEDPTLNQRQKAPQPLGMEVPAELAEKQRILLAQQAAAEDEDDNIFQGVESDYDPLAGIDSGSEGSDDERSKKQPDQQPNANNVQSGNEVRNYFFTSKHGDDDSKPSNTVTQDPNILAALKRAAALRRTEDEETDGNNINASDESQELQDKRKRFLEMLKQRDREDAQDIDLGFGDSRFGDEDDEDGAIWAEEGDKSDKRKAHKRGSKKRKGDKDNVKDVLDVLEGRKKADS